MQLEQIGSNQTMLTIRDHEVLFSYKTAVAIRIRFKTFVDEKKYSVTTSKHVTKFVRGERIVTDSKVFKEMLEVLGLEG